jgi:hypothetical protein
MWLEPSHSSPCIETLPLPRPFDPGQNAGLRQSILHTMQAALVTDRTADVFETWWSLWIGFGTSALGEILQILALLQPQDELLYQVSMAFWRRQLELHPHLLPRCYYLLQQVEKIPREKLKNDFFFPQFPKITPRARLDLAFFASVANPNVWRFSFKHWRTQRKDEIALTFPQRINFLTELKFLFKSSSTDQKKYFGRMTPEDLTIFYQSWLDSQPTLPWDENQIVFLLIFLTEKEKRLKYDALQDEQFWRYLIGAQKPQLSPIFQWGLEHHKQFFDHRRQSILGLLHAGIASSSQKQAVGW